MHIMMATIAAAMRQVYDVVGQRFTCIAKMPVGCVAKNTWRERAMRRSNTDVMTPVTWPVAVMCRHEPR